MKSIPLNLIVDSEYIPAIHYTNTSTTRPGNPICVQVADQGPGLEPETCHIFWNKQIIPAGASLGTRTGLFPVEIDHFYDPDEISPLELLLSDSLGNRVYLDPLLKLDKSQWKGPTIRLSITVHYSPKDLEYLLGYKTAWMLYGLNRIIQRRGVQIQSGRSNTLPMGLTLDPDSRSRIERYTIRSGTPYCLLLVSVHDTYSYCGTSLDEMGSLLRTRKEAVHDYDKRDMLSFLLANPDLFRRYAIQDVIVEHKVSRDYPPLFRSLFHETIGLEKNLPVRRTMGSNIAHTILQKIESKSPTLLETFGLIRGDNLPPMPVTPTPQLQPYSMSSKSAAYRMKERGRINFQSCGMQALAEMNDTRCYGAIVNGGRCRNEQPWRCHGENVIDVDMVGCYSTALDQMTYPVGIPTVKAFIHDEFYEGDYTLKNFLDEYGSELIDDLWTAVVDGTLSFAQDLIPSFDTDQKAIKRSVRHPETDESEVRHIEGEYRWLGREIRNGILNSTLLGVIKAVGTNREKHEIMGLKVKCALFYPKSRRVDSFDELEKRIREKPGGITMTDDRGSGRTVTVDDRCRYWTGFPLAELLTPWREERSKWKERSKELGNQDTAAKAISNHLKLGCNTVYGVVASPYFPIGNTVLANNITANARVGMWMMAKACGAMQSITDGGLCPVDEFRVWEGKRPGLAVLADVKNWVKSDMPNLRRSVITVKPEADSVMKHIRSFWSPYDLAFRFQVEIKGFYPFVATWNKADYYLIGTDGSELMRKRGYREYDEGTEPDDLFREYEEVNLSTTSFVAPVGIMRSLALGHDRPLTDFRWTYNQSMLATVKSSEVTIHLQPVIMPGDEVIHVRRERLIPRNLSFDTLEEARAWDEYWNKAGAGLEILIKNTSELKSLMVDLYNDPLGVLERHKGLTQESGAAPVRRRSRRRSGLSGSTRPRTR